MYCWSKNACIVYTGAWMLYVHYTASSRHVIGHSIYINNFIKICNLIYDALYIHVYRVSYILNRPFPHSLPLLFPLCAVPTLFLILSTFTHFSALTCPFLPHQLASVYFNLLASPLSPSIISLPPLHLHRPPHRAKGARHPYTSWLRLRRPAKQGPRIPLIL